MVKFIKYRNGNNASSYVNLSHADYISIVRTSDNKYAIAFETQQLVTSENINVYDTCCTTLFRLASYDTVEAAEAKLDEIMTSQDEILTL